MALSWLTTTTAPLGSFEFAAAYNGYVYGVVNTGAVYSAPINADGTLGAWTATTAIPAPQSGYVWTGVTIAIGNGYLWVIGGSMVPSAGGTTTNFSGNCMSASLSGGVVGAWTNAGQGTPNTLALGEGLVVGNYIYYIGGHIFSSNTDYATVYMAPISGGSITGAFVTTTALPYTQSNFGGIGGYAWSDGSYIYLEFGYANGGTSGVIYSSPVGASGTLGAWTSTTALPTTPPDSPAYATAQGRIYMMGGQSSGNALVYSASYSGGVLSAWQAETSLSANLIDGSGFATADTIYSASGYDNTTGAVSVTYYALLASAPNADTLTYPANGSFIDATTPIDFTSAYNSTDGANANARAMRLKYSSASSYNYWNVSTGAQQSTEVFNSVNIAPGASGTFTVSGLANANVLNWDTRSQESLANLDGPYGSDFTVNLQLAPNLSINDPVGSVTTTNAPSLQYTPTPASGASVTGGRWLIYPLATTQASGFSINIGAGTIPSGAVSDASWTGNPLTVAIQSGVTLTNGAGYVAYAAVTETGSEWSTTISSSFTISLDQPATPSITVVPSIDTATTPPLVTITVQGHDNILSADDASSEGGLGTLTAGANTAIAQSSAQHLDGSYSVSMTSTAAGAMSMKTASNVYAVLPNTVYTIMDNYRAAVTPESCRTDVAWYDSSNTLISTTQGQTITDATTAWTESTLGVTSPANAAWGELIPNVLNTAAAGEVHYSDNRGLFPGTVTQWSRGGLAGSMYATVVRADGFTLRQSPLQMTAPAQQAVFTDYEAPGGFTTSYTATESVNV